MPISGTGSVGSVKDRINLLSLKRLEMPSGKGKLGDGEVHSSGAGAKHEVKLRSLMREKKLV